MKPARSDRAKRMCLAATATISPSAAATAAMEASSSSYVRARTATERASPASPATTGSRSVDAMVSNAGHGMQRIVATSVRIDPFWSAKRCLTKFS